MDHRFSRRLLGVAVAMSLSVSPFASTPALPSEHQTLHNSSTASRQLLSPSDTLLATAVVLSPGAQRFQPPSEAPDSSKLPKGATPEDLRLRPTEATDLVKSAPSGVRPAQEGDVPANEQDEENEADTEAAPDLVVSEEEPGLTPPDSQTVSIPELDPNDFDVPVVLNEQVKAYILYYQTRKWGVMSRAFERSGRYLPMMRQIFRDHGLPLDLVNLAYVESAFNYRAYSRAKASGIWQFIKATGNRYGMKVSYWLDERRDPEKATRGAATYLKELYETFHSWPLALAAYNAGEQRVQRAIERQGTTDFWSLRLPKETKLFVPAFMAATIIAKDPNRYGFVAPIETPWAVERVTVPGAIELRSVARAVGLPSDQIRDLNPAFMRGVTPVNASEHEILLPPGAKEILLAHLDQLPRYSHREPVKVAVKQHRVRRGETLESIASQHQMTAAGLASLNGVKVGDRLKVGALLRLPPVQPSSARATTFDRTTRSPTSVARVPEVTPPARSAIHIVKRGDTLWGIARAYAVTPEELRRWNDNDLRGQAKLRPGQALQVVAQTAKSNREARRGAPASIASALYHRVKKGDTLWEIARAHDVTPEELRRWNDLGHQAKLQVGQEIMIRLNKS
ncbi:MAG: LysM peptidoglycan-binding domain-containing protein [candidate division NC10 bacterium]|nr:LysM peptidoglycan-binding domain-containing protein [candidate division NC10 bacterium]